SGADAFDLLAALMRVPSRRPIRVIAAYRSTEIGAGDPLGRLLPLLLAQRLAERHELGALVGDEAAALLGSLLGKSVTEADSQAQCVLRRARGVPFYLVSWAHALRAGETIADDEIPYDVVELIRWRIRQLPTETQELLGVAATSGRSIPLPVLLSVG